MGRPIAFLNRPNPVTAGAQFEPGGLSAIPGSGIGVLLAQKVNGGNLYGGVYYLSKEKLPEYNIGLKYKSYTLGGFYSDRNYGIAGTIKVPDLLILTLYHESTKTNSGFVEVVLGDLGAPYVSVIYDRKEKLWDSEIGWTKEYSIEKAYVLILIGLGYMPEAKVLNLYFWIHL